jgi:hypothetical protein
VTAFNFGVSAEVRVSVNIAVGVEILRSPTPATARAAVAGDPGSLRMTLWKEFFQIG